MTTTWQVLAWAVLPLWIVAGFTDWVCHWRTGIQATVTGTLECRFHWIQFFQSGLLVALAFLFETTGALLCTLSGIWLLHELTTYAELRTVAPHRNVAPAEQMVHSLLELLPMMIVLLLTAQWLSDRASAEEGFRFRSNIPLSLAMTCSLVGAVLLFNILPLIEEAWRCAAFRSNDARTGRIQ